MSFNISEFWLILCSFSDIYALCTSPAALIAQLYGNLTKFFIDFVDDIRTVCYFWFYTYIDLIL